MTEFHQIDDDDESAEEFLRKIESGKATSPGRRRASGGRRRGGQGAPGTDVTGRAVPPWLAASASLLVWGAGQILNGRIALGIMFLSFQGLVVALFYSLRTTWESWVWLADLYSVDPGEIQMALLIAGTLVPMVWFTGVLEAYSQAARHPRARVYTGPSFIPAAASALVPGWGQILNDQLGKAAFFLTVLGIGGYILGVALRWPEFWSGLDPTAPPLTTVDLPAIPAYAAASLCLLWLIGVVDAFMSARKR